jgi:hypothetical protein
MVLRPPAGKGNEHYMAMEKGTLLRAVREDDLFSDQIKGVSLSVCTVWAVVSAADDEPSAADLTRQRELKGATTLRSLLHGLAGNVFVRIQGIAQHAAGELSSRLCDLHVRRGVGATLHFPYSLTYVCIRCRACSRSSWASCRHVTI